MFCSRDNARFASPADQERLTLEFSKGHDNGSESGAAVQLAGGLQMWVAGSSQPRQACCPPAEDTPPPARLPSLPLRTAPMQRATMAAVGSPM